MSPPSMSRHRKLTVNEQRQAAQQAEVTLLHASVVTSVPLPALSKLVEDGDLAVVGHDDDGSELILLGDVDRLIHAHPGLLDGSSEAVASTSPTDGAPSAGLSGSDVGATVSTLSGWPTRWLPVDRAALHMNITALELKRRVVAGELASERFGKQVWVDVGGHLLDEARHGGAEREDDAADRRGDEARYGGAEWDDDAQPQGGPGSLNA